MRDCGRSRWTYSPVRINRGDTVLCSLHPEGQHERKVMRHKHASRGGSETVMTEAEWAEGERSSVHFG